MSKKKQQNREVYERAIKNYKYSEGCEPVMYDNALDLYNIYGTSYPTADKNDYSRPVREYKKNEDK
ncbi:MAG: hypothetical protein K2K16_03905 [Ruminococcus sp.]|nr:hypothetical protein [Ruminococcus sp.]